MGNLHAAVKKGDISKATRILDYRSDLVNKYSSYGDEKEMIWNVTPLHIACDKGFIKTSKMLLRRGADINATTNIGLTPLHFAARRNFGPLITFLLKKGANPKIRSSLKNTLGKAYEGKYPVDMATFCKSLFPEDKEKDTKRKVVEEEEEEEETSLAFDRGFVMKPVYDLFSHEWDEIKVNENSPLHKLVREEDYDKLVNIGCQSDSEGWTCVHHAAYLNKYDLFENLIQSGNFGIFHEFVNILIPKFNVSALHIAAKKNYERMCEILLKFGAKASLKTDSNVYFNESWKSKTPMELADNFQIKVMIETRILIEQKLVGIVGKNKCTFIATQKEFFLQKIFKCNTCEMDCLCGSCIRICHQGHSISPINGIASAFCDCPLEYKCKCSTLDAEKEVVEIIQDKVALDIEIVKPKKGGIPPALKLSGSFQHDDTVYIFGGIKAGRGLTNKMYAYGDEKWKEVSLRGHVPSPRCDVKCYDAGNGVFIFYGGREKHDKPLDDCFLFNLKKGKFTNIDNDRRATSFSSINRMSFSCGKRCYLIVDSKDYSKGKLVFSFDPKKVKKEKQFFWEEIKCGGKNPGCIGGGCLLYKKDNDVFIYGGYKFSRSKREWKTSNHIFRLNVANRKWDKVRTLGLKNRRTPTFGHHAIKVCDEYAIVLGGANMNSYYFDKIGLFKCNSDCVTYREFETKLIPRAFGCCTFKSQKFNETNTSGVVTFTLFGGRNSMSEPDGTSDLSVIKVFLEGYDGNNDRSPSSPLMQKTLPPSKNPQRRKAPPASPQRRKVPSSHQRRKAPPASPQRRKVPSSHQRRKAPPASPQRRKVPSSHQRRKAPPASPQRRKASPKRRNVPPSGINSTKQPGSPQKLERIIPDEKKNENERNISFDLISSGDLKSALAFVPENILSYLVDEKKMLFGDFFPTNCLNVHIVKKNIRFLDDLSKVEEPVLKRPIFRRIKKKMNNNFKKSEEDVKNGKVVWKALLLESMEIEKKERNNEVQEPGFIFMLKKLGIGKEGINILLKAGFSFEDTFQPDKDEIEEIVEEISVLALESEGKFNEVELNRITGIVEGVSKMEREEIEKENAINNWSLVAKKVVSVKNATEREEIKLASSMDIFQRQKSELIDILDESEGKMQRGDVNWVKESFKKMRNFLDQHAFGMFTTSATGGGKYEGFNEMEIIHKMMEDILTKPSFVTRAMCFKIEVLSTFAKYVEFHHIRVATGCSDSQTVKMLREDRESYVGRFKGISKVFPDSTSGKDTDLQIHFMEKLIREGVQGFKSEKLLPVSPFIGGVYQAVSGGANAAIGGATKDPFQILGGVFQLISGTFKATKAAINIHSELSGGKGWYDLSLNLRQTYYIVIALTETEEERAVKAFHKFEDLVEEICKKRKLGKTKKVLLFSVKTIYGELIHQARNSVVKEMAHEALSQIDTTLVKGIKYRVGKKRFKAQSKLKRLFSSLC